MEDPAYWRTVRDKTTGREVVLTQQQMELVQRLQSSHFPEEGYDQYEVSIYFSISLATCPPLISLQPYVDFFSGEKMIHPLNDTVKPKLHSVSLGGKAGVATGACHQDGLVETTNQVRQTKVLHVMGRR